MAFQLSAQSLTEGIILNGASSHWTRVTSGVPQGSVLGQWVLILYINDLPDNVTCGIKLFPDDSYQNLFRHLWYPTSTKELRHGQWMVPQIDS